MKKSLQLIGFILLFGTLAVFPAQAQQKNVSMYSQADPTVYYLSTNSNYHIPFNLRYMGPTHVANIKYSYSVNDGTPIKQTAINDYNHPVSCVNAVNLSIYRVAFSTPVEFGDPGLYKLKIWIDSLDGFPDSNPLNDTMVRWYKAMDDMPVRKGLSEYGFHVTCGPCGENAPPYIHNLLNDYEDYMVMVKLHNYDGSPAISKLNCPESIEIDKMFTDYSHPKFTFNRADIRPYDNPNFESFIYYPDAGFCPTNYNYFIRDVNFYNKAPVSFEVNSFDFNEITNQFSLSMNARFSDDITFAQEARMSCMLVEDSIYDYQYDNGLPGIDSTWHRYVLRAVLGGSWGLSGSLPASVTANQNYAQNLSCILKTEWNKKRLYLIPSLQYYNSNAKKREVLNVRRLHLSESIFTSNLPIVSGNSTVQLFPNPATDRITISLSEGKFIKSYFVSSIDGKMQLVEILPYEEAQQYSFSTAGLSNGIYFVKIRLTDGQYSTLRVVVNR